MKMWLFPLWVIINVLVALAAVSLWITAPDYRSLNWGLSIFALTLGITLILLRWSEIKTFIHSSYFKKLLYHSINIFLILAIVGVINYLGNKNVKEFDLTFEKRNTLSDQTQKVLQMIKHPLSLTLYARREEWKRHLDIFKLYQARNKNITIDAVDTDIRPDVVRAKNITENGTVIINYNGEENRFVMTDELSLTNALLKALRDDKIILYSTTGHGELSCSDKSEEGLSSMCERLAGLNYQVRELDLTKTTSVPLDATAVLILGPTTGFLVAEARQLEEFLNKGGSLFLALAPAFKSEVYNNLIQLARPFGLKMGRDVVIDRLSTIQGSEATIPIVNAYDSNHSITLDFNLRTVFPLSSSVSLIEGNDAASIIASTSSFPGSWAESDLEGVTKGKAEYNEGSDLKGPVGLMGVGERVGKSAKGHSRFVLLGSSSFLINAYQNQTGNPMLFLNTVSWMVSDEGIISLNRPGMEEFPVILSSMHLQMIFFVAILLVPIVFFGSAIFIYRRRRLL
jgi:ABC-2 type transport system permease protein